MSKPKKYIWVLYEVSNEATLAQGASLPDPDETPITNYCSAIYEARLSLLDSNGIQMVGVWDYNNQDHTINKKIVDRTP